ncbi:MAG: FkbM family methyltransferase [Actinomycetota bacterium]|nr:FkbM family methyltransferase [Actinomycetota bacterium]
MGLKKSARAAIGRMLFGTADRNVAIRRLGSSYGGADFSVDDVQADSVVYSFGIGLDASFEVELSEQLQVHVHAFDPTLQSIEWVAAQDFPDSFIMHNWGLAAFDGDASFCPPENQDEVSHTIINRPSTKARSYTVSVKRLETTMRELRHEYIDLLKLDIEGAEYTVIEDMLRSQIFPRQILIEFHHWALEGMGPGRTRYGRTLHAIRALKAAGYLMASNEGNKNFVFVRQYS